MEEGGNVYLELTIGFVIELSLNENDETLVILFCVVILIFIAITGTMIGYLCVKVKKIEKKIKSSVKIN